MSAEVNRAGQAARLALQVNLTTERGCAVARARAGGGCGPIIFQFFLLETNSGTLDNLFLSRLA